jgi:hypothetical protein
LSVTRNFFAKQEVSSVSRAHELYRRFVTNRTVARNVDHHRANPRVDLPALIEDVENRTLLRGSPLRYGDYDRD